ncbi:Hpy99I family type II restriction endonuclease [Helicobacter cinaedi]|uniref:Recombination endonuclease VII n=2 Tax=Helicobacter TaxID=209 RepID=A0AAI8MQW9_9HELI|nr:MULTISPECIES: Hpy99I family type II restriction endonuclease [Campylobacterales]EFR46048.1 recombination endonuclease VII [Helicobacter cinaedi CCUG 18818 = ATCC BAA-847]EHE0557996.1 Hpy99I family type II restriction endonuclease [Campylobacter upsaliensis]KAA8709573.1 endonuclease [Helicobacter canis]MCR2103063.1 Hpy99I family type II restriction endonuclease [Campylobacter upsaliensis]MDL0101331.1 Hpy99I family type II restriction endonuclease [Campylobacter felis]
MLLNIDNFVIANKQIGSVVKNSVGIVKAINGESAMVLFIGVNEIKKVNFENLESIDIYKTGKGFDCKICNICHILKDTGSFEINQTDAKGNKTTRPSCRECRKHIDGVKLSNNEKKRMDKIAPPKGSIFTCPICEKRSIVGVTANLVRDHNHETGEGREWICDSCNTGLGRFKDNPKFLEKVIEYLRKYEK